MRSSQICQTFLCSKRPITGNSYSVTAAFKYDEHLVTGAYKYVKGLAVWWKFISQNCSKRAHKCAEGLPKAELTIGTLYGDTNRKTGSFARTKALNNLEFCRCASDEIYTDDGAKIFIYLISEYWMKVHYLKHFHCCQAFYTTFNPALWSHIRDLYMWLRIRR